MKHQQSRTTDATSRTNRSFPTGLWALVLAGGDGVRLRDLTGAIAGAPIPKQYCRLLGQHSLFEAALDRAEQVASKEHTLVIVTRDHLGIAPDQLARVAAKNVLVQPSNRDTGPGVLFALLELTRRDPGATVAVFPSDHFIGDDVGFAAYVERAVRIVAQLPSKVVILGIRPDRPESGFGYIATGEPLKGPTTLGAFHVEAFVEKPAADLERMLRARGGLWNSFVMVFRVRRMVTLLRTVRPEDVARMRSLRDRLSVIPEAYDQLDRWNFSSHFLGRIAKELVVVRVDDLHWNDWGTPNSIYHTLAILNQAPPWSLPVIPSAPPSPHAATA